MIAALSGYNGRVDDDPLSKSVRETSTMCGVVPKVFFFVSSGAESGFWKQETMQGEKPVRVVFGIESLDLHNVPLLLIFGIAERNLIFENVPPDEFHRLQMRMELVHDSQGFLE